MRPVSPYKKNNKLPVKTKNVAGDKKETQKRKKNTIKILMPEEEHGYIKPRKHICW